MHPDPASFNAPETFTRTIGLGESLRRRRAPMILALLLVGLLGSLAFIDAGSPLNVVIGGLAGLALAAAIGWFGHLSDRSTVGTATLVLESEGLRYEDAGTHRALRWPDAEYIGPLQTPDSERGTRGGGLGWVLVSILRAADARPRWGIVGRGMVGAKPGAGQRALTVVEKVRRLFPSRIPGIDLVPIYPEEFDPAWTTGRIGAWVERFRPDLLDAAIRRG